MLDASGSVGQANWGRVQNFISNFVSSLKVSSDGVRVSKRVLGLQQFFRLQYLFGFFSHLSVHFLVIHIVTYTLARSSCCEMCLDICLNSFEVNQLSRSLQSI